MRKSEIFENYVKIAQEKGLIPEDAPQKAKEKLEKNPRADSMDLTAIEALYGIKPNAPKDMEYKNNIVEIAHKGVAVVSPAYDRLNGIVPNQNQAQSITINKLKHRNTGHLNNAKYAKKDLLLTLVKIANDLDAQNETKLYKLADSCLEQVSNDQIKKQAFWAALMSALRAAPTILRGVGAVATMLWMQQHAPAMSEMQKKNLEDVSKKLKAEISDLGVVINDATKETKYEESSWRKLGFGYDPVDMMIDSLKNILIKENEFKSTYLKYEPLENCIKENASIEKIKEALKKAGVLDFKVAFLDLSKHYQELEIAFQQYENLIKDKSAEIKGKGIFTGMADRMGILLGGLGLVHDDFDDVESAIEEYRQQKSKILSNFNTYAKDQNTGADIVAQQKAKMEQAAQKEIDKSLSPEKQSFIEKFLPGQKSDVMTTSAPPSSSDTPTSTFDDGILGSDYRDAFSGK